MAPRYQQQRKVKNTGYNKYNGGKLFEEDFSSGLPLTVNKDFNNQYKQNMDLTNKAYLTNSDPKDFHKLNQI